MKVADMFDQSYLDGWVVSDIPSGEAVSERQFTDLTRWATVFFRFYVSTQRHSHTDGGADMQ